MPATFATPEAAQATARRRREERERLLASKTALRDAAIEAERAARAERHRLEALPVLADRLAQAVFDHVEANAGRPVVRDQLAATLHSVILSSGLWRDPRRPPPA
jgi:hypothetical protein